MARTQKYGIEFPIQIKKNETLFDLNKTQSDKVKSDLVHLIFTPEGQKLRDPLFGTNLIKYLFDPNMELMWDDVVMDIKDKVEKFISNCEIIDITTESTNDGLGVMVKLIYTVIEPDGIKHQYELIQNI